MQGDFRIIYVDRPVSGSARYVEHWVLFDEYTHPSMIRPSASRYESAVDFLAHGPFGRGYR
jgi:hypothetical protein